MPSNATNQTIYYTSSDTSVATVDRTSGKVVAKKAGTAVITATSAENSSVYATCLIVVKEPIRTVELSYFDALFISQLVDPKASFNQPGSKYAIDFDRAYDLLQLYKEAEQNTGKPLVSGEKLEKLGYCAPGAGDGAEAIFNIMYNTALSGKTMLDQAVEDHARWQSQLNLALTFMYQSAIFQSPMNFTITDNTFSPNSRLDMIEKDLLKNGFVYKMQPRTLRVTFKENGPFRSGSFEHVFLGVKNGSKVSGYHYEGVYGAVGKIEPGTKTTPNRFGVYTAKVAGKNDHKGISSFFPPSMKPEEIIDEMGAAYYNRTFVEGNTWKCYFSNGMEVRFYLDKNDQIISFFPWYEQK